MPQEPWHPRKGANPDPVIPLNYGEVRTHTSNLKQPEPGRASTTEEQKYPFFQTNYD